MYFRYIELQKSENSELIRVIELATAAAEGNGALSYTNMQDQADNLRYIRKCQFSKALLWM